jgi:glycerate 2-kinase
MKIVLAPDSFKGSLSAAQVCDAMAEGIRRVLPTAESIAVPMADGGEGTVQSLVDATGGTFLFAEVLNPLGIQGKARYGILGDGETAVIEIAEASGLYLISQDQRNPMMTTSYGIGQLILSALDQGCRHFIIGLGGSATNDGGAGMAQALGAGLLDGNGEDLAFGGGQLHRLATIDAKAMDPRLHACTFTIACDVDNVLCGPTGASAVFGPQKGATPLMVEALDKGLEHYAAILEHTVGKPVRSIPGAGAAGGLGAGMLAFLNGRLRPGFDIVREATGLETQLIGADLVLTGEGRCDIQTLHGKVPFGVAKAAQKRGIPVVMVVGAIGAGSEALYDHGVHSIFSLVNGPMSAEDAMKDAAALVKMTTENMIRTFMISR